MIAAYNALSRCLVQRRRLPARDPLHHLLELFDAVAEKRPKIQAHREAVRTLEELRTTWVTQSLNRWPVEKGVLLRLVSDVLEVLRHLGVSEELLLRI